MNFHLTPSEPLKLTEADVVRQCTDYLRYRGWWVQRNPVGLYKAMSGGMAEFGPPGIPDYTAIHALYPAFFLEFKAPKKKLRTTQVIMFRHIQEQFGLTVVKIDNLEEMIEWLGKHEGRGNAVESRQIKSGDTGEHTPGDSSGQKAGASRGHCA